MLLINSPSVSLDPFVSANAYSNGPASTLGPNPLRYQHRNDRSPPLRPWCPLLHPHLSAKSNQPRLKRQPLTQTSASGRLQSTDCQGFHSRLPRDGSSRLQGGVGSVMRPLSLVPLPWVGRRSRLRPAFYGRLHVHRSHAYVVW